MRSLVLLMVLFCAMMVFADNDWKETQYLTFQGMSMILGVDFGSGSSQVFLQTPDGQIALSQNLNGDNIAPAFHIRDNRLFISWVNYSYGHAAIVLWSWSEGQRRVYPFPGFSFVSSPRLLFTGDSATGMLFLGNQRGNDDLFAFDFQTNRIFNLTCTPYSEKDFHVEEQDGSWRVEIRSLSGSTAFRLNRSLNATESERAQQLAKRMTISSSVDRAGCESENTFIAFGDSITWGKMRMNNLDGEYHPELAYPALMEAKLKSNYGFVRALNISVPGEGTFDGAIRVNDVLEENAAGYFLLMEGTNDCISNMMSVDSVLENLDYIVDRALAKKMNVVVSTIPPRKDSLGQLGFVRWNIDQLNAGIRSLVSGKWQAKAPVSLADTYQGFMNYLPPDGWKALLEDSVGNHPSPKGHEVIADLFVTSFIALAPKPPASVTFTDNTAFQKQVEWPLNCESDFDHYEIWFGFSPGKLSWKAVSTANGFTFVVPPFLSTVYFQISSVDKFGNISFPSETFQAGKN